MSPELTMVPINRQGAPLPSSRSVAIGMTGITCVASLEELTACDKPESCFVTG
jgi:hypothetical protein